MPGILRCCARVAVTAEAAAPRAIQVPDCLALAADAAKAEGCLHDDTGNDQSAVPAAEKRARDDGDSSDDGDDGEAVAKNVATPPRKAKRARSEITASPHQMKTPREAAVSTLERAFVFGDNREHLCHSCLLEADPSEVERAKIVLNTRMHDEHEADPCNKCHTRMCDAHARGGCWACFFTKCAEFKATPLRATQVIGATDGDAYQVVALRKNGDIVLFTYNWCTKRTSPFTTINKGSSIRVPCVGGCNKTCGVDSGTRIVWAVPDSDTVDICARLCADCFDLRVQSESRTQSEVETETKASIAEIESVADDDAGGSADGKKACKEEEQGGDGDGDANANADGEEDKDGGDADADADSKEDDDGGDADGDVKSSKEDDNDEDGALYDLISFKSKAGLKTLPKRTRTIVTRNRSWIFNEEDNKQFAFLHDSFISQVSQILFSQLTWFLSDRKISELISQLRSQPPNKLVSWMSKLKCRPKLNTHQRNGWEQVRMDEAAARAMHNFKHDRLV